MSEKPLWQAHWKLPGLLLQTWLQPPFFWLHSLTSGDEDKSDRLLPGHIPAGLMVGKVDHVKARDMNCCRWGKPYRLSSKGPQVHKGQDEGQNGPINQCASCETYTQLVWCRSGTAK